MNPPSAQTVLLAFAPMIDSELSRFVLRHHGISFREERHLFGWASLIALFRGGTLQIPLLSGAGLALAGPRAIADHFDRIAPAENRLVPVDPRLASEVEADWQRFNGVLASATAVIGYYYLLPQRAVMIEPFSRGVPGAEARALKVVYPALAGLFKLLLRLDADHVREALAQTRAFFDETDRRVADGRAYLAGDRLTLSDIALATACAPVLLPQNYGSPMPPLGHMPSELRAIISEMRDHKTAQFVEEIFRKHR